MPPRQAPTARDEATGEAKAQRGHLFASWTGARARHRACAAPGRPAQRAKTARSACAARGRRRRRRARGRTHRSRASARRNLVDCPHVKLGAVSIARERRGTRAPPSLTALRRRSPGARTVGTARPRPEPRHDNTRATRGVLARAWPPRARPRARPKRVAAGCRAALPCQSAAAAGSSPGGGGGAAHSSASGRDDGASSSTMSDRARAVAEHVEQRGVVLGVDRRPSAANAVAAIARFLFLRADPPTLQRTQRCAFWLGHCSSAAESERYASGRRKPGGARVRVGGHARRTQPLSMRAPRRRQFGE